MPIGQVSNWTKNPPLDVLQFGIVWSLDGSKKTITVAKPFAKFRAVAQGICELLWIKRLLSELNMVKNQVPMKLYNDNKAAINIVHNPVHLDWTKHVEIDLHFIKDKEKIEKGKFVWFPLLQRNK